MSAGQWRVEDGDLKVSAGLEWHVCDQRNTLIAVFYDPDDARACVEAHNAQGWRDISSAPRDGTCILVSDGRACRVVKWYDGFMGQCWFIPEQDAHGSGQLIRENDQRKVNDAEEALSAARLVSGGAKDAPSPAEGERS